MREQLQLFPQYLSAHLELTLWALLLGVGASVPLGVLVHRYRRLEAPVLGFAGIVQTIPALALLAVMVPILGALHLENIGFLPAFLALVLYSMLPILRNTVTGLDGVDPAVVEAARAMGMTAAQRLRQVELPLALPAIVAGVRTATVWTVGMATLSTPVGAPSFGNYIFSGLQTRNAGAVLLGCLGASALAVGLDALVHVLESAVRSRRRSMLIVVLVTFAGLYGYVAATRLWAKSTGSSRGVVIGTKSFTEQYILGEILARVIETEARVDTSILGSLGSTVAFDALRAGQIDVYVEYSGTILATIMKRGADGMSRDTVVSEVSRWLAEQAGVEVAASLGFENAYVLAMRDGDARRLGVRRLSELVTHAPDLSMGSDYEFLARAEWARLRDVYGLRFRELRSMDPTLMYQAAAGGSVDVISAFSTDGRIDALDLRVLEDDRGAIPPYDALVLMRSELAAERPAVAAALRRLDRRIDADGMRRMNREVDERGADPAAVAASFATRLAQERAHP